MACLGAYQRIEKFLAAKSQLLRYLRRVEMDSTKEPRVAESHKMERKPCTKKQANMFP